VNVFCNAQLAKKVNSSASSADGEFICGANSECLLCKGIFVNFKSVVRRQIKQIKFCTDNLSIINDLPTYLLN